MFFLWTTGTGHCPFSLYKLFITSIKGHFLLEDDFLLGKDKLLNLNLKVVFIVPRSRVIFEKFEGKSVENNWN